jgi:1-aminocyclopropane-1-carboxylate deaminase
MQLHFVDRQSYRQKETPAFIESLKKRFGRFYLVPQGGTNELAVQGTMEILNEADAVFDYIACAIGTGGTIAGIINSAYPHQKILGFPALKENFLHRDISRYVHRDNWRLIRDYHFGVFAKINADLVHFINDFYRQTGIPLDPVYTGKMLYGLFDMIAHDRFEPGTEILAVHTGGLQGIDGMNNRLRKKRLPTLDLPSFYNTGS